MNQINESYLERLIGELHTAENEAFSKQQQNHQAPTGKLILHNPRLEKLNERKVKTISSLKYTAKTLKTILEQIQYEIDNPKIKLNN